MANSDPLSDGNVTWAGGMDTSRSPVEIGDAQYSRAANVVIPRSLGGIRVRPGFVHQHLQFTSQEGENIFRTGELQAEGWFNVGINVYLVAVVNGVVFRMSRVTASVWRAEDININDRNSEGIRNAWVSRIPDGVIVNNGYDMPLIVKARTVRRSKGLSEGEIGPGRMGVYVQNRFFYVNATGTGIRFSNFLNPTGETESALAGVDRFIPPENGDQITAIGKQKVMLDYVTGGALIFSTRINIYSVDVRGDIPSWRLLNTRVGKVTETVESMAASSAYSFESFGSNLYFRNFAFGICDLRQSQYQFNQFDTTIHQSVEAAYWLDNDTEHMLDRCYTRAWQSRLMTTVTPEQDETGRVFWNGILCYHPDATYSDRQAAPRRFESVFTGLRVTAMSAVKISRKRDSLFVYSWDKDGQNRLYMLDEKMDHDINHRGKSVEIEGWIEFRALNFKSPVTLKDSQAIFYHTKELPRDIHLKFFARNQTAGRWTEYAKIDHLIEWVNIEKGIFKPVPLKPQVRGPVNLEIEDLSKCSAMGRSYIHIQDRVEFTGAIHFENFIRIANPKAFDRTATKTETKRTRLEFTYRPDYTYYLSEK